MFRHLTAWLGRCRRSRPAARRRPTVEALEDRTVPAALPAGFTESTFASGFGQPTSMSFAPDGRLFVTQKTGDIRVVENGRLLPTPFLHLNVNTEDERGVESMTF